MHIGEALSRGHGEARLELFLPLVERCCFDTNAGRVTMAGMDNRVAWQREQLVFDRFEDAGITRKRAAGRSGATVEEGVARKENTFARKMQTTAARGVARRVDHRDIDAADAERLPVAKRRIDSAVGVDGFPQHGVVGVQPDWGLEVFGDLGSCVDVIVVGVRAHDGLERAVTNGANDGFVVVCTIKHDTLSIVADDPHIVVDVEVFAIKRKDARGGQMVDGSHASTLVS